MDYTNVNYTNMDITILKAVILIKVGQIFFFTCMLIVILRSIYQQTNRSVHEHEQDKHPTESGLFS